MEEIRIMKRDVNLSADRSQEAVVNARGKKVLHADVVLLAFIVFAVLLAMTGFTFLRQGSVVLTGDEALAKQADDATPDVGVTSFSFDVAEDADGAKNAALSSDDDDEAVIGSSKNTIALSSGSNGSYVTDGSGAVYSTDDPRYKEECGYVGYGREDEMTLMERFDFCIDCKLDEEGYTILRYVRHDADGNWILNSYGEPIADTYRGYHNSAGAYASIDLDEALGLKGVETDREMVENALQAKNAGTAYAAQTASISSNTVLAQNSESGSQASLSCSGSDSRYNSGEYNIENYTYITISGGSWSRWRSNSVLQVKVSYSHSYGGNVRTWYLNIHAGGVSYSSSDANLNSYFNIGTNTQVSACYRLIVNGAECADSAGNFSLTNNYYFKHTNASNLAISWNKTSSAWAHYRASGEIYITATSSIDYVKEAQIRVTTNTAGTSWSGYAGGTGYSTNSQTVYSTSACYNKMEGRAYDYAAVTKTTSASATNLCIDNKAPTISLQGLYSAASGGTAYQTSSNTSAAGVSIGATNTTLYLRVTASDSSDSNNGASGVQKVYATRNGSGTYNFTLSSGIYYYAVSAQDANAQWTIYVLDNSTTNGSANSASLTFWVSCVDCSAPTGDSNIAVNYATTKSNAGSHWTVKSADSYLWSSAPLYCSINFADKTGSTYYATSYYKRSGINTVTVAFWYNGSRYAYSCSSTSETGAIRLKKSIHSEVGTANADSQTCTVSFYMPYDSRYTYQDNNGSKSSTTGLTVTATDFVGHSVTKQCNTGSYHIDTVAPKVNSVTLSAGSSSWTNSNVTLTVKAQDYDSSNANNNYSGVYAIYVYVNNPQSSTAAPVWEATSCTTVSTNNNQTEVTKTFNIYDKYKDSLGIQRVNGSEPRLYIVAVDWAGNRSDSYNGYAKNSSYSSNTSSNSQQFNSNYTTYYASPCSVAGNYTTVVYFDLFATPVVEVFSDSSCSTKIASSTASGAQKTYYYPYQKDRSSITFYVKVTLGASGGKLTTTGAVSMTSTVADYRTNGLSYNTNAPCSATTAVLQTLTVNTQGEKTTLIEFAGGSGNKSAQVSIVTRIDTTKPTIAMKGFYSSAPSTATAVNSPTYSEATLATGAWTKNSLYVLFQVTDNESGVARGNSFGYGGYNGTSYASTATVSGNNARYTLDFKYVNGGNTYSKSTIADLVAIGSVYYLRAQLFNTTDMSGLKANGSGRTMLQGTEDWDIAESTYLQYQFSVTDWIGNSATYASTYYSGKSNSASSTWVSYKVDPFPLRGAASLFEVTSGTASALVSGKTLPVSGKATYYGGAWTKNPVILKVTVKPSLSGGGTPTLGHRESDSSGAYTYDDAGHSGKETITSSKEYWYRYESGARSIHLSVKLKNGVGTETIVSAREAATSLGETSGQLILIRQDTVAPIVKGMYITATNSATASPVLYFDATKSGENYTFSLNTSKSTNYKTSGSDYYVSTTNSSNKVYYTWLESKVYMYFDVTDKVNGFEGAGVVTNNTTNQPTSVTEVGSAKMTYGSNTRTNKPVYSRDSDSDGKYDTYTYQARCAQDTYTNEFGYTARKENYQYTVTVLDSVGNSTTCKFGGEANTTTSTVKYSMLPFIDATDPYIKLSATNSVKYSNPTEGVRNGSYTYASTTVKDSTGAFVNKLLGYKDINGENYYTQTDLNVTTNVTVGISGYSVYLRLRDFRENLANNTTYTALTPYAVGRLPSGYNFGEQGWGSYVSKVWTLSADAQKTKQDSANKESVSLSIAADDIRNRFDILVVNGTGKYYLIEAGDVIMDRSGPAYYDSLTFFTRGLEGDAATLNYNNDLATVTSAAITDYARTTWVSDQVYRNYLYKSGSNYYPAYAGVGPTELYAYNNLIWPYAQIHGITGYSNGPAYAYFCIDDICGVDDASVKIGSTTLDKVTVTVPVYTIGGVATRVLYQKERVMSYSLVSTKGSNGCYQISETYYNGSGSGATTARTIPTDITFVTSSAALSTGTATYTFYRYKMTDGSATSVTQDAADQLGNAMASGSKKTYYPKFERNDITLTLSTVFADGSKEDYTSTESKVVYTNRPVDIMAKVVTHNSGFGYLSMTETYKRTATDAEATKSYNILAPIVTKSGTTATLTAWTSATATSSSNTSVGSATSIEVTARKSGSSYVWYVNGQNTTLPVYNVNNYYQGIVDYSMKLTYVPSTGTIEFSFGFAKDSDNDRDSLITMKAVSGCIYGMAMSSTLSKNVTDAQNKYLNLDYTAPTIDTSTQEYKAISAPYVCENCGYVTESETSFDGNNRYCTTCRNSGKNVIVSDNCYVVPRLLSLAVSDNLSGVGQSIENQCAIDKVKYSYQYNNESGSGYLFNKFTTVSGGASDGKYRPCDYLTESGKLTLTDLVYCNYKTEYTVTAIDKAGNETTISFTPNIDATLATVDTGDTLITVTDPKGGKKSVKSLGLYNVASDGEIGAPYTPGTWSRTGVLLVGKVSYGASGVVLQGRFNAFENKVSSSEWSEPLRAYTDWNALITAGSGYYVYSDKVGELVFGIPFAASSQVTALYEYYSLRALSTAAYRELESGTCQMANTATCLVMSYSTTEAKADKNGLYLLSRSGKTTPLDGVHDTGLISIDKVQPTIGVVVTSSGRTFGSASGRTWTCTDNVWVNKNVVITVSTTQEAAVSAEDAAANHNLDYASGNVFYYTTDMSATLAELGKWTKVVPQKDNQYGLQYRYLNGEWTLATTSTSVSITAQKQANPATTNDFTTGAYYAEKMVFTLSGDQNCTGYKFFVESGAGNRSCGSDSEVFTVKNIRLDSKTPSLKAYARSGYKMFDTAANGYCEVTEADYNSAADDTSNYTITDGSGSFTCKNSVILQVEVKNIGYSGVQLYIKIGNEAEKPLGSVITYEQYVANGGEAFYMYYAFCGNMDEKVTITARSVAYDLSTLARSSSGQDAYIRIDNSVPMLYVKDIYTLDAPGKASNWNVAEAGDKWYVSELKFDLVVGTIVPKVTFIGGEARTEYEYSPETPTSGFTVWYRVSYYPTLEASTRTATEWMEATTKGAGTASTNTRIVTIGGTIRYYNANVEFKVVSNSVYTREDGSTNKTYGPKQGDEQYKKDVMSYIPGEPAHNNEFSYSALNGPEATTQITDVLYGGNVYSIGGLQAALGAITGHTVDGVEGDGSFTYLFNIDTYTYTYTYDARIYVGILGTDSKTYNTNTADLVEYTTWQGDWSGIHATEGGTFTKIDTSTNVVYHHGDIIEIRYTTKTDGAYRYFHDYTTIYGEKNGTVYSGKGADVFGTSSNLFGSNVATDEPSGSFAIKFETNSVAFLAEFGAELEMDYTATTYFIQFNDGGAKATTASTAYEWNTSSTQTERVMPEITYKYFDYSDGTPLQGAATSLSEEAARSFDINTVGAYYVVPHIAANTGKNGNFRVLIRDRNTAYNEERQTFVVKYFNEELVTYDESTGYAYNAKALENFRLGFRKYMYLDSVPDEASVKTFLNEKVLGYYVVYDQEDLSRIDKTYYNYDESADSLTMCSYLKDTNGFAYKLMADLELEKSFVGLKGKFEAEFNGDGRTITHLVDSVRTDYGMFEEFAGTIRNLRVVAKNTVYVAAEESDDDVVIGFIARRVTGGRILNVSVTADFILQSNHANKVYIGGIAGQAYAAEIGEVAGEAVYTDLRVKNNGSEIENISLGGMFGRVDGTIFNNAVAFGDITVYNTVDVKVGLVAGEGVYGAVTDLNYLANNTFVNDEIVYGATMNNASVGTPTDYDTFVYESATTISTLTIAGKQIRMMILQRLYLDFFGVIEATEFDKGLGVAGNGIDVPSVPLQINTIEQFAVIDDYVNLSYKLTANLDMASYVPSVAIHKVFGGVFDGNTGVDSTYSYLIKNFAGDITTFDAPYFGLFGMVNGTVQNLVFTDIDLTVSYTGDRPLYAGIVAGELFGNADINNIVLIGTTRIRSENEKIYVGSVAGYAYDATVYDVFNMNNMSIYADDMVTGGVIGMAEGTLIADNVGHIYSLGRVEVGSLGLRSGGVTMGAVVGNGSVVTDSAQERIFFIEHNAYIQGLYNNNLYIDGNGAFIGRQPKVVEFSDETMRSTSFERVTNVFNMVFVDPHEERWYPLTGAGLATNPFVVENEDDFRNINVALYGYYKITQDIAFTEFVTVGEGLDFTGTIDGSGKSTGAGDGISAEVNNLVSLTNVTGPLVYNIKGAVQNIIINTIYNKTIEHEETLYFGAVAVYSSGNIKNITVQGSVNITGEDLTTTAYVSGYVAVCQGGSIEDSKLRNAISALSISVRNVGTVYTGGFAASVEQGEPVFSFGIASAGTGSDDSQSSQSVIRIEDCGQNIIAGLLVGQVYGKCNWSLALSEEYYYTIIVEGKAVKKTDDEGNIINIFGRQD